jgi:lipoprotein-releasing system ATP-binding protein
MSEPVLELVGIERSFRQANNLLTVLRDASLTVGAGELVGLIGPSGAGKSTLLHIAGLLERPTAGSIRINGRDCARMSEQERTQTRRSALGFVYQYHHLLPEFSALENVVLPQLIAGTGRTAARQHAESLLARVGLSERMTHRPAQLSGGEQQRVALVRALANRPRILFGDEPTGNLDVHTAADVMDVLIDLVRSDGLAAVIATHNYELARRMDRVVVLEEGALVPWTDPA